MSISETVQQTNVYPQSKEVAGTHYWSVLFNTAAQFPDSPTLEDKKDTSNFIKSTIKRFTCDSCIENAFDFIRKHPIDTDNRESLMKYICRLKNNANEHEGKQTIDCDQFVMNSLNKEAGCSSCTIEPIKSPTVTIPSIGKQQDTVLATTAVALPKPSTPVVYTPHDNNYMNIWNWENRYPSLKRSVSFIAAGQQQTEQPQQTGLPQNINQLQSKYPSLSNFDLDNDEDDQPHEEVMDGILTPIDSIYAVPANFLGLKPYEMNLAYTPEILTNGISLLSQMYLSNAGGLLTTLISSLGLLGVSIFARNSLSHYDRLFVQNTAASMLFHSLNFLNPRIKDELIPDLQKLSEGVMAMNVDKIKDALLFGHKSEGAITDEKTKELIEQIEAKNGKIDMKKLLEGHNDIPGDLRSILGKGKQKGSGSISRNDIDDMLKRHHGPSNANYSALADTSNKFDYILENDYL